MVSLDNVVPRSIYEVMKFLKVFHLRHEKIHSCVNDFCLFIEENKDLESCPICSHLSGRWIDTLVNETRCSY